MSKGKKIAIIVTVIVVIALIAAGVYFGIRAMKINKYTKADTYKVKGMEIASVKAVLGEKKIKSYSYKKNTTEILELTFVDSDKEASAEKYISTIKDSGNYIEMEVQDPKIKEIANPADDITTVRTEITDDGFKVRIEVGPGKIQINHIEE